MSFGLVGASGTGKTTLAKDVAAAMSLPYHDAGTTRLLRAVGWNPVGYGNSIETRLEMQEFLLSAYLAEIKKLPRPFITDRTPLDMAAYTLGEVTMTNCDEEMGLRIANYVERCKQATRENFDSVAVIGPLPSYDAQPTRPPPNKAYQRKIHLLVNGLLDEMDGWVYAILKTTEREARATWTTNFFMERLDKWREIRKSVTAH